MRELRSQLEGIAGSDEVGVKEGLAAGSGRDMANGGDINICARSKKKVDTDARFNHFACYLAPCGVFGLEQRPFLVSIVKLRVFTKEKATGTPGRESGEGTDDFTASFFEGREGSVKGWEEGRLGVFNVEEEFREGGKEGFDHGSMWGMISLQVGYGGVVRTWIRRDQRIDLH